VIAVTLNRVSMNGSAPDADKGSAERPAPGADDEGSGPMDTEDRVEAAADELYGVPPDDFVPVRDELVTEAKEAGDKEAAKAIGRFRRPTQAAWLANLLARERGDQLDALLDLAEELSSAQRTLDGAQLRHLSAQRSKLVGAMAREARRLAAADGHRVTESVEKDLRGILEAALADDDVADEVRSGRLTRTVSWSGFGFGGETTVGTGTRKPRDREADGARRRRPVTRPARRPASERPAEPEDEADIGTDTDVDAEEHAERERREREAREQREREIAEAREALDEARRAADTAADAHEDAAAALREAESDRDDATARVEELTAELERAREARTATAAAVKDAAKAEREAGRTARDTATALARAEERLAELEDD
jgi:DNA repair exonuclease SbcCD ATPase subunit